MRNTRVRSVGAAAVLLSCTGGTTTPPPTPPPPPPVLSRVEITEVRDVENFGDGRDLEVAFDRLLIETGVAEYRVMVEGAAGTGFDLATADAVPPDRYRALVPTGDDHEIRLVQGALDTDGAPIEEGTPYVVFVLAVSSDAAIANSLSDPSGAITLAQTNLVRTLTAPIDAGSGGIAVDAQGNIYTADFGASLNGPPGTRIHKVTPGGEVSVFATGFSGASGNAFDSMGNLFQSNIAANRISKVAPDGTVTTFATSGLSSPVGIAIDSGDNLFVANCGNNTIQHITAAGVSSQFAAGSQLNCPNGIALASDGNLYVANFSNGSVVRVLPDGTMSIFASIPGRNNGHITFANDVLYVVARNAHQLYQLELDGTLTLLAGTGERGLTDGAALTARLSLTNDVAISPDGSTLYFNDVVGGNGTNVISPVVIRSLELLPPR